MSVEGDNGNHPISYFGYNAFAGVEKYYSNHISVGFGAMVDTFKYDGADVKNLAILAICGLNYNISEKSGVYAKIKYGFNEQFVLGSDTKGITAGGELGYVYTLTNSIDTVLSFSGFLNFPKAYVDIFSNGRFNMNLGFYYKF